MVRRPFAFLIAITIATLSPTAQGLEKPDPRGFSVTTAAGLNVKHPWGGLQLGRRFVHAPFLELYGDYSYDATISRFPFHTLGIGARTYFCDVGWFELYLQSLLGLGVSGGGSAGSRDLGERLLGAFVTQGVGAELWLAKGLYAALTVSTGYPVWLRSELALRYRF